MFVGFISRNRNQLQLVLNIADLACVLRCFLLFSVSLKCKTNFLFIAMINRFCILRCWNIYVVKRLILCFHNLTVM